MDFAGPASTLEFIESEDSILILVIPRRRWIDILIAVFAIVCLSAVVSQFGRTAALIAALVTAGLFLFHWHDRTPQSLFVTQYELISSKGGTKRWNAIYGITHVHGGEDDPSGLYTEEPFGGKCILELTEDQTLEVITAIYRKFPFPVLRPEPPPSLLSRLAERIPILGGASRLTTLNLSNPEDPKA